MSNRAAARLIGALFLSAFLLYGGGTALGAAPLGLVLILANSLAVAAIGVLFHQQVQAHSPVAANSYLVARTAEAIVLVLGGLLLRVKVLPAGSSLALDIGMTALGLGSIPLFLLLHSQRWLPRILALWGVAGYSLLTIGSILDLAGLPVALWCSIPGGLFELVFGIWMLTRGLSQEKDRA